MSVRRLGIFGPRRKLENVCMSELVRRLRERATVLLIVQAIDDASDEPQWPAVDVLLAFSNDAASLAACLRYCERVAPILINDVAVQLSALQNRVAVWQTLQATEGVNVCSTLVVDHTRDDVAQRFVETDDAIELDGHVVRKPFVEKPLLETDHSVRVYWPAGGGCLQLFRKTRSESSAPDAACNAVRRDGCYLYQPFIDTGGVDVKAYAIGSEGVYAEARVAPTAASSVERDPATGKQRRTRVELRDDEVAMVQRAAAAFRHQMCGVDLLRDATTATTYVCDVNGWAHLYADEYFERAVRFLEQV